VQQNSVELHNLERYFTSCFRQSYWASHPLTAEHTRRPAKTRKMHLGQKDEQTSSTQQARLTCPCNITARSVQVEHLQPYISYTAGAGALGLGLMLSWLSGSSINVLHFGLGETSNLSWQVPWEESGICKLVVRPAQWRMSPRTDHDGRDPFVELKA
jgi:hypothetical protein